MAPFYDYRIAAGYGVSIGSLVNIETIQPTSTSKFYPPKAVGFYNPGDNKIRGDGLVFLSGFATVTWFFDAMTRKQYEYLSTTYCNSGWSGKVTIYTVTTTDGSYARYNAVMVLPKRDNAFYFDKNVNVQMTRLAAL